MNIVTTRLAVALSRRCRANKAILDHVVDRCRNDSADHGIGVQLADGVECSFDRQIDVMVGSARDRFANRLLKRIGIATAICWAERFLTQHPVKEFRGPLHNLPCRLTPDRGLRSG